MEINKNELAKFFREAINNVKNDPAPSGCFRFILDEDLAIFIGWLDGYDPDDGGLHANDDPTWCLNAAIRIRNDFDWSEFGFLDSPLNDDGELVFQPLTISVNDDPESLAEHFINEYSEWLKATESH